MNLREKNKSKSFKVHQIVVMAFFNVDYLDVVIEHIDGELHCNRVENLKVTPKKDVPTNIYSQRPDTWYVQIRHKKKKHYLGTFYTLEEAIQARDDYKKLLELL